MTWWQGIVLGIVQGLTEFLPISSSGHLVVTEQAFGLSTPGVFVEVVLHVATLLAVLVVYRVTIWRLVRGTLTGDRASWRYVGLLAIATVPAGIAGLWLEDLFTQAFEALALVGVNFVITGVVLWSTRGRPAGEPRALPSAGRAVGIGVAQAFAILPGISRSGSTVAAAMWLGVSPVAAAEFSFLMALPTIAGAALLQVGDLGGNATAMLTGPLVAGFVAALVSGVAAIQLLVALLRRRAFHHFAPYCWGIGIVTIVWALVR